MSDKERIRNNVSEVVAALEKDKITSNGKCYYEESCVLEAIKIRSAQIAVFHLQLMNNK